MLSDSKKRESRHIDDDWKGSILLELKEIKLGGWEQKKSAKFVD